MSTLLVPRNKTCSMVATRASAKGLCKVSSAAVDLVLKNFPRKDKEREFIGMIIMAHRYNEQLEKAFPRRETFAGDVGCSDRHAKRLWRSLQAENDIFPIKQGGKGPGSVTEWRLNPKYLPGKKGDICASPIALNKGGHSSVRKGGQSFVGKGGHTREGKRPHNINKQKENAAAASAVFGSPPPLRSEPDLDHGAIAKFQADFERSRGRKLLGAN